MACAGVVGMKRVMGRCGTSLRNVVVPYLLGNAVTAVKGKRGKPCYHETPGPLVPVGGL